MRSFIKSMALYLFLTKKLGRIQSDDCVFFARSKTVTALKITIVAAQAAKTSSSNILSENWKEATWSLGTNHSCVKFTKKCGCVNVGRQLYARPQYVLCRTTKSYDQISVHVDAPLPIIIGGWSTWTHRVKTRNAVAVLRHFWNIWA